ncbi:BMC domain-containing protein [Clostridium sp.]|uniref:BMC domain-containing protein n=1 Tax=Clostridium sp. TaxID=1506 RepID=UPI0035A17E93
MVRTIGMVELNSIAKGIKTADAMVKAAEVKLLLSKTVCPGKYIILITGNVGAVTASIEAGVSIGGQHVVDKLLLPNVHEQVIPAINEATGVSQLKDLGVMEFFSISTGIVAADAAAKSADVQLIEVRMGVGVGGKSFVTLTGDVSAVKNAVEAGVNVSLETGMLVNSEVISGPSKDLLQYLL